MFLICLLEKPISTFRKSWKNFIGIVFIMCINLIIESWGDYNGKVINCIAITYTLKGFSSSYYTTSWGNVIN